ncbi:hypothetical protein NFI96_000147 [Prochilodus magdalenae]|nr:hypothetical protein NFI96_000147 [Prochilodus magdalenae]
MQLIVEHFSNVNEVYTVPAVELKRRGLADSGLSRVLPGPCLEHIRAEIQHMAAVREREVTARLLWETMLVAKQKEAVMEVRRQLVEAASKENLPIKMSLGRVTAEQLSSYVQLFRGSWGAVESHSGVLQLGLATAHTLRHPALARWDACLAFERLLLQDSGQCNLGGPNLLARLFGCLSAVHAFY